MEFQFQPNSSPSPLRKRPPASVAWSLNFYLTTIPFTTSGTDHRLQPYGVSVLALVPTQKGFVFFCQKILAGVGKDSWGIRKSSLSFRPVITTRRPRSDK